MKTSSQAHTCIFAILSFLAGIIPLVLYGSVYVLWESGIFWTFLMLLVVTGFPFFVGMLAIILGIVALVEIKKKAEFIKGKTLAILGIIFGLSVCLYMFISELG